MVLVGQSTGLCLGMIGGKRFCLSKGCTTKSHSKKFVMGCEQGWFIPSKSRVLQSGPMAFIPPFLDASKIMGDTHNILTDALMCKTTAEWEGFIVAAKEEWVEFEA